MDSKVFATPKEIMEGPGVQLFDHIAKCLADFVHEKGLKESCLPLGFTFSFPLKQEGLAKGRLVTWTKGFSCAGVVGEDVVHLFHEAIKRYSRTKVRDKLVMRYACWCYRKDTVNVKDFPGCKCYWGYSIVYSLILLIWGFKFDSR